MVKTEQTAGLPAIRNDAPAPPRRWGEWWIERLIRGAGISTIVLIGLIFVFLLREGLPAFVHVSPRTLFGVRWYPIEEMYGLVPLLVGSLLVTVGAVVIAVPLGLITAIYLGEIAPKWQREVLKPLIEVLAGIPSIVLGFLGWVVLAPLIQRAGAATGLTAFTGSLDPGLYVAAHDYQHFGRCAVCRAEGVPRRGARHRRHRVADDLARGSAGGALRHCNRDGARHWPRHRRDHGGDDGDG